VFLTQRSGLDAVCVDRQEGTFPIKTFTLEIGMRRPLGVGIGSLAILSALPEEEIRSVIVSNTPRLPEYGLTPTSLAAQVKRAQKIGYAVREMPTLAGVRSIGQAVHNQGGIPFAALSVSAISSRMNERRVGEVATMLRSETRVIEKQLANGSER
jgi:DNA-binding IclR family transcriptional regulator